jgi:hypothetical protein
MTKGERLSDAEDRGMVPGEDLSDEDRGFQGEHE